VRRQGSGVRRPLIAGVVILLTLGAGFGSLFFIRYGEYAIPYAVRAPVRDGEIAGARVRTERAILRGDHVPGTERVVWAGSPEFTVTVEGAPSGGPILVQNALPLAAYESLPDRVVQRGTDLALTSAGTYRFRPIARESYSFLVTGDPHGRGENLRKALHLRSGALFAFCLGDITHRGLEPEFEEVAKVAAQSPIPVYFTIGNHDLMNGGRRIYRSLFGAETYSFWVGRDLFAVFDTAAKHPYLGDDRIAWLDKVLSAPGARHRLAFMHIPPIDPRPNRDHAITWGPLRRGVLRTLEERGVEVAFAGHIHDYTVGKGGKVPYVITGGLTPDHESTFGAHAVLVSVSPRGVTWKRLPLDNAAALGPAIGARGSD
jgi:predicted phosphodiesterase